MRHIGNAAYVSVASGSWGHPPLIFWEWQGQRVRVSAYSYIKNIGNGFSIRENTGEVFREDDETMESIFCTADSTAARHY